MNRTPRTLLSLLLPFLLGPSLGEGQEEQPRPNPGESLTVSLVTIGQGDPVWERFGHNALLFQDRDTGWEVAYHWGVFNFGQVDFVPRLIRGTMLYSMGPTDFQASLAEYRRVGRSVWIQELALSPEQRWALLSFTEENYRPENRDYRYDYYRDNCSTRVRDALDHVLGGPIERRFGADTTAFSYRWHTRRILQAMPPYYLGIQFVLGPRADRPITVWEEMFLPMTVRDRLREIRVPGPTGQPTPLVVREEVLHDPGRSPLPTSPPFALPIFMGFGILWGAGILALVGRGGAHGPLRRAAVAGVLGVWGLVAALGGTILVAAWTLTDHVFWYENFNLFQVNPLFLPLPVALVVYSFRRTFPRWAWMLAGFLGVLSLLGLALELIPGWGQTNGEILALTLPLNLAAWLGAHQLYRGSVASGASSPGGPTSF